MGGLHYLFHIKIKVGKHIDLVDDQHIAHREDQWILQGLVMAFRHRKDHGVFLKGEKEYGDFYSAEVETKESIITVCDYADVSVKAYGVEYCTEKDCRFFRAQKNRSSVMFANNDWSNVKICRGNNGKFSEELMITAIYSRLCEYNTLFMHASFVDLNGNGVIFAGPSGIGKTTQAELWAKHLGATVVNGDKAFVRAFDKDVYGYGAPWSGSSPYCLNKKSVLKAYFSDSKLCYNSHNYNFVMWKVNINYTKNDLIFIFL